MKATVSGIAGRSELATGEACGKSIDPRRYSWSSDEPRQRLCMMRRRNRSIDI